MSDRAIPPGTGRISGRLPTDHANAISDAIAASMKAGMEPDEAIGMTIQVAVDYARQHYGDAFALQLADFIRFMVRRPMPKAEIIDGL